MPNKGILGLMINFTADLHECKVIQTDAVSAVNNCISYIWRPLVDVEWNLRVWLFFPRFYSSWKSNQLYFYFFTVISAFLLKSPFHDVKTVLHLQTGNQDDFIAHFYCH